MLDGHYAAKLNRVWDALARALVASAIPPNAVTVTGLALVSIAAGAYAIHRNGPVFAACLAVAFAFDGLDGAVARITGRATHFGGYLDAVIDRYQEIIVLAAIAWVRDLWPHAFLVVTGGLLTSYAKARVALEIPIDNGAWPDLLERLERVVLLIALLALEPMLPVLPGLGVGTLGAGLVLLGVLTHATALQRFARARRRLKLADRHNRP